MGEKKAKITLSGLGKGGSSNAFMSFRFSPESEEIEEITQAPSSLETRSESAPASPKATSGDVSPLKEYLLKEKHKWTNKWDKKSLSLDLDLKGKIKTAIEDRTKSILSNFIPEETGVIHQSQSIPENFTTRVFTSVSEENSSSSSSDLLAKGDTKKNKNNSHDSSGNGSQETLDGDDIFKAALDHDDVEEIGLDMTDNPNLTQNMDDENMIERIATFNIPPDDLQEVFDGLPTLYQPLSLISGIRVIPLEMALEDVPGALPAVSAVDGTPGPNASVMTNQDNNQQLPDFRLKTLMLEILSDIVYHPWTKYWFAILAGNYVLPFGALAPVLWFLLGCISVFIVQRGLSGVDRPERVYRSTRLTSSYDPVAVPMYKELRYPTKCQGWMTEMEGDYDVASCHFRQTRVVYVRIDSHNLYLSYPHPKHRVPKRRLWNDPVIDMPFLFLKIKVYNISGADISIVPTGLVRKRVWNKKYPIAITFPKYSVYHNVTPSATTSKDQLRPKENPATSTAVNYNVSTAGVSVKQNDTSADKPIEKEIARKDCSSQTIYLFARCDREKDDWFRRFIAASKLGTEADAYDKRAPPDPLKEYRDFMKRACPSLTPFIQSIVSDTYDNVSLVDMKGPTKDKETPSSSKKTTPEKEKVSSHSTSFQSDLENVVTIPQSPTFLNALLGRLFFDFLKSAIGRKEVQKLIDKKLSFMKKPSVIKEIHVKELDLGNSSPVILRASPPVLDHQGLWIDLDITYEGNFCVSLETQATILKPAGIAKKSTDSEASSAPETPGTSAKQDSRGNNDTATATSPTNYSMSKQALRLSHVFDSDADDSGESSEDEADIELDSSYDARASYLDPNDLQTKSYKFMKLSEKIANSPLMNQPFVKKLVKTWVEKPIVLAVELQSCIGTVTINIPPPPSDRVWLGFRTNPDMQIVARPQFGNTNINVAPLTEWIRKKILSEFQRAAVCPNMVDISIPYIEFKLPK